MSPTDLGQKHECEECDAKFYDLGKSNAPCPACGHVKGSAKAESKDSSKKKKKK